MKYPLNQIFLVTFGTVSIIASVSAQAATQGKPVLTNGGRVILTEQLAHDILSGRYGARHQPQAHSQQPRVTYTQVPVQQQRQVVNQATPRTPQTPVWSNQRVIQTHAPGQITRPQAQATQQAQAQQRAQQLARQKAAQAQQQRQQLARQKAAQAQQQRQQQARQKAVQAQRKAQPTVQPTATRQAPQQTQAQKQATLKAQQARLRAQQQAQAKARQIAQQNRARQLAQQKARQAQQQARAKQLAQQKANAAKKNKQTPPRKPTQKKLSQLDIQINRQIAMTRARLNNRRRQQAVARNITSTTLSTHAARRLNINPVTQRNHAQHNQPQARPAPTVRRTQPAQARPAPAQQRTPQAAPARAANPAAIRQQQQRIAQQRNAANARRAAATQRPRATAQANKIGIKALECGGNGPFWNMKINLAGNFVSVKLPTSPAPANGRLTKKQSSNKDASIVLAGKAGNNAMQASLTRNNTCTDGITSIRYPYAISTRLGNKQYKGCCSIR